MTEKKMVGGIEIKPGHPVAAVLQDLLNRVQPFVPRGYVFLLSIEDPEGTSTCGGNGTMTAVFELAVSSARQLLVAAGSPELIQVMRAPGRRGRA